MFSQAVVRRGIPADGAGRRVPGAMTAVTVAALAALGGSLAGGCTGGGRGVGELCDTSSDCSGRLQCFERLCVPRCLHHVDCGDGYTCDDGECNRVDAVEHAPCESELECGPGLTCRLRDTLSRPPGTCERHTTAAIPGATCALDDDCSGGACALGHCLDLCAEESECQRGWTCAAVPRLNDVATELIGDFEACLPESGTISFELPIDPDEAEPTFKIPVPSSAVSAEVVLEVADPFQRIGATEVLAPTGGALYRTPFDRDDFYQNAVRHVPAAGVSVVKMPGSPEMEFPAGAYTMKIAVFRDGGGEPSRDRTVRVVEKLGQGVALDLHFYFADLTDHPCAAQLGPLATGGAAAAPTMAAFQEEYLAEIRSILAPALAIGTTTYENVPDHPELAGLETTRAGELFALNKHQKGVAVFLVRTISPAGVQVVVGGTPGSPLPETRSSGVAVSVEPLCYRDWHTMARQTAHAIARHLGLFRNVEPDGGEDPILDSPATADNLLHYSEFAGTALSPGQREMLRISPVLQ
jgi:hypothetical protein